MISKVEESSVLTLELKEELIKYRGKSSNNPWSISNFPLELCTNLSHEKEDLEIQLG